MDLRKRLASVLSKLSKDNSGNVAITVALAIIPLIGLACGSVDVIRMTSTQQRLQAMVDSATLAAASLSNTTSMEETVTDYMTANQPDVAPWDTLTYSPAVLTNSLNKKEMKVTATVTVATPFLSILGIDSSTVSAESTAIQAATNIEISMVLDISSSMNGAKVKDLRESSKKFIDLMLEDGNKDYTSINLVLFGGTVNIGNTLFNRYVNGSGKAITNPNQSEYYKSSSQTQLPYRNYLFSNGNTCVEYTNEDFDLNDIPVASRPQLPHFFRYGAKNDWCPDSDTESIFNSNNAATLKARIDAMNLSDGTGMDIGTMWGAKALSPDLKGVLTGDFSDRPAAWDDEETLKIAVIMTDGEITDQTRPRNPSSTSRTDIRNSSKRQRIVSTGNKNNANSTKYQSKPYFKRMCDEMKAQGVQIYTIGFQIKTNKDSDWLLNYCATSPSNYYYVEGLNLEDAFNSIAASVNSLRISG